MLLVPLDFLLVRAMAAVDQASVEKLVEAFSAIYAQEINELITTPLANNPTRTFIKVMKDTAVDEDVLNNHVMFREHCVCDTDMRKCFYNFRAALIALDQEFSHKLTMHSNPL